MAKEEAQKKADEWMKSYNAADEQHHAASKR
jgi:hypothetical protein